MYIYIIDTVCTTELCFSKYMMTSSYKLNQHLGCSVQRDEYNSHCCMLYMKAVRRADPKTYYHKEKTYCFISLSLYLYEMMDTH